VRCLLRRRLPIEDVVRIVEEYEKVYGSPEVLRRRCAGSRDDGLRAQLAEWIDALRALREYEEEGEEVFVKEEEVDPRLVRRILSPGMVELIEEISRGVSSISDLARRLNRSTPNVYNDLKFLAECGIVGFHRKGRSMRPYLLAEEILIEF